MVDGDGELSVVLQKQILHINEGKKKKSPVGRFLAASVNPGAGEHTAHCLELTHLATAHTAPFPNAVYAGQKQRQNLGLSARKIQAATRGAESSQV